MSKTVTVEKETQCNLPSPAPEIRKVRDSTYKIKDTIASVSTKAGVSVEKARVATQVVAEKLYDHRFELSVPTQSENPPPSKKPRKSEDFQEYKNVLPSPKTINKFKHKKALRQEIIAAKALYSKKETTTVTLHFDTTSRSRINGDWPALILNFKDDNPFECRMLNLRALPFGFEDREQIVCLVVETLTRLTVAGKKLNVTVNDLWCKIDAFMTDSVTKNLKVVEGVAKTLNFKHIPYHILCKSHTCERMDSDNLSSLSNIEGQIGLRELIIRREPCLKSFLRGRKCVVEAAMEALLKLVATEGDGKTISLGPLFDLKLEEAGVHKSLCLYKEKRFTRMGYQAGAILDCLPYFRQILDETPLNNLLVRNCRIYLENDFIIAGLKALANFTYKVTMPYLNCVEKSDQNYLVEMLPKLHRDLLNADMDTLCDYHVDWTHVNMENHTPTTDLDNHLMKQLCLDAAAGVFLQCNREYWTSSATTTEKRAKALHELTPEQRKNLPTNNLCCERYLGRFGYIAAQSAAQSNKNFKGKRIRDDLMTIQETDDQPRIDRAMISVIKELDEMEIVWTEQQKKKQREKLLDNLKKKKKSIEFVDIVLKKCKEHHGPVTSVQELKQLVQKKSPNLKSQLRLEIQYHRETHRLDAEVRSDLCKVNSLSVQDMIENLSAILSEDPEADESISFPCEDEIMAIIINARTVEEKSNSTENQTEKDDSLILQPNQPVAVVWDVRGKKNWYMGFFIDTNDDGTCR